MSPVRLLSVALLVGCSTPYPAPLEPSLVSVPAADEAAEEDSGLDTADGAHDSGAEGIESEQSPPCVAWGATDQAGTVEDAALNEISGVAASRRNPGVLWVMEDHAAPNEVTALDPAGKFLGRIVLDGVVNFDWEDLAVGNCGETTCLFVGEIGDNDKDRGYHAVLRVPEPEVPPEGGMDLTLTPDVFPFEYPDGAYDSEALVVQPDGLPAVFTKEYDTEQSTAYTFPTLEEGETVVLERRGRFSTGASGEGGGAAATAADLWEDGSRLILRTYGHIWEFTLTDGGFDDLEDAARVELTTGTERQGEAIAYDPFERAYYTISEDVNPPVWRTRCSE